MLTDRKTFVISIIIPTLNEEKNIGAALSGLRDIPDIEIIVVDGGSDDQTVSIAKSCGAQVISAPPGRACQMNKGAKTANGDILLFLHGDTILPAGFEHHVRQIIINSKAVAGAFPLSINASGLGIRLVEKMTNFRAKYLQMPYGDQAIFISAGLFRQMGGFPKVPLMEDFALIRKLRKKGRIEIVPLPVLTSGRRWKKLGVLRTTCINQIIILGYLLGLSPGRLADWYRNRQKR